MKLQAGVKIGSLSAHEKPIARALRTRASFQKLLAARLKARQQDFLLTEQITEAAKSDFDPLTENGSVYSIRGGEKAIKRLASRWQNGENGHGVPVEIKNRHCIFVIAVDIDGLKEINDKTEMKHRAGDIVICRAAWQMSKSIKYGRDLLIRPGGDEFLIFGYVFAGQNESVDSSVKTAIKRIIGEVKSRNQKDLEEYFPKEIPDMPKTATRERGEVRPGRISLGSAIMTVDELIEIVDESKDSPAGIIIQKIRSLADTNLYVQRSGQTPPPGALPKTASS